MLGQIVVQWIPTLLALMTFSSAPSGSEFLDIPESFFTGFVNWLETFDKSTGWYDRELIQTVLEVITFGQDQTVIKLYYTVSALSTFFFFFILGYNLVPVEDPHVLPNKHFRQTASNGSQQFPLSQTNLDLENSTTTVTDALAWRRP